MRLCGQPQKETDDARAGRGQRKSPAGLEIGHPGRAPGFQHDGAKLRTAKRLVRGLQHIHAAAGPHQNEHRGIEAERGQPRRVQPAAFAFAQALPDPYDGTLAGRAHGQTGGEAGHSSCIGGFGAGYLVQSATRQPPAEGGVQGGRAQLKPVGRLSGVVDGLQDGKLGL